MTRKTTKETAHPLDVPSFLLVANRKPLSPARQREVDERSRPRAAEEARRDWSRPRSWDAACDAILAEQEAARTAKRDERLADLAARRPPPGPPRERRPPGRPAKSPEEFRAPRPGTARASVLAAMDGTRTLAQIAAAHGGKPEAWAAAHAHCTHRDCGVGFEVRADGTVLALWPEGKKLK